MGLMLTKGFRNVEVGPNQLLMIKKVVYDDKFGKLRLLLTDRDGGTMNEFFSFWKSKTKPNEVALNVFSTIAKAATGDWTEREIEPAELVGCYLVVDVIEQTSDDGKVFKHIRNVKEAEDFEPFDIDIDDDEEDEDVEEDDIESDEDDEDDLFD